MSPCVVLAHTQTAQFHYVSFLASKPGTIRAIKLLNFRILNPLMPTRPWHNVNEALDQFKRFNAALAHELTVAQGHNNRVGIIGAVTQIGYNALDVLAFLNGNPCPLEWIPSQQWGTH